MEQQQKTVKVNGITLYYEQTGSGRPLIMVHGNGEDHTIFDKAADVLQSHFTVYLIDSRGHGKSTPLNELHYDDMAADMLAFIDTLGLDDIVFYGFSDGGIVALLAAAQCQRITTLIVSGANLNPQGVKPWLRMLFKVEYFFKRDPKIRLMMTEPQIPDALLQRITAETLVLAGSKDLIIEEQTRQIAAVIPRATLKILPGESHGSYIVHNEMIGTIIRDFAASKHYRFYGWQTATVKDRRGLTPCDYYDLLSELWCADTCAPRLREQWSTENKTKGQCSVTAFLLQDIYGGKVCGVPLSDGNYHCFNIVGSCVFDLTSEQFGDTMLDYTNCPEQRREEHFKKEEKRQRYERLKAALNRRLDGTADTEAR